MNETHASLDRLEARLEDQAARIDALYRLLELRGILPRPVEAGRDNASVDGQLPKRRASHIHVGTATGV